VYRLIGVILTKNEARHISACVAALRPWVDAVVVWDSDSSDDTQRLAQQAGALVVTRPFDNYAAQRQAALDALAAEWILFVDADERVTPARAPTTATGCPAATGLWGARSGMEAISLIINCGWCGVGPSTMIWRARCMNWPMSREQRAILRNR
jgi:glycosyltransferase involved in cell wall biosynthesis